MPLHVGSAGRILLAWLDREERERLWRDSVALFGWPGGVAEAAEAADPAAGPVAAGGPTNPDWQSIRRDGWTASMGERDSYLSSLSVPIFGENGEVVGALTLSGPRDRLSAARMEAVLTALRDSAAAIRRRMVGTSDFSEDLPVNSANAGRRGSADR